MATPNRESRNAEEPASGADEVLASGTVIADRYRVVSLLGRGGMGAVYRVEHVHMRKAFALKVLYGDALRVPEIVARFGHEAVAAAKISHPNVVAATDFGKLPDGSFFLVLELVDGRSLRDVLDAGALDPARATKILRGITTAVAAAHRCGIVHRDLKPENVMLVRRDGDDDFVKVLDFGIARLSEPQATGRESGVQPLTRLGTIMGTPEYMSPEQALGQPVDARSDLYALGVIFFELITGACPFRGSGVSLLRQHITEPPPPIPTDVVAKLDPRVSNVIARLLAKEPGARFQTASELLAAVDGSGELDPRVSANVEAADRRAGATSADVESTAPAISNPRASGRRLARITAGAAIVITLAVAAFSHFSDMPANAPSASPTAAPAPPASTSTPPSPAPTPSMSASPPATTASVVGTTPSQGSARTPPSRPPRGRKTGPGGIYIPPPREWLK